MVTRGAAFIGSHLADLIAKRSHRAIVADTLYTDNLANIELLLQKSGVEFSKKIITNLPLLQKLSQGAAHIFRQAAMPSVPRSIENLEASSNVNVTGIMNIL